MSLNRRERRKLLKDKNDKQAEYVRTMYKPMKKIEVYALVNELEKRLEAMDKFLTSKYGEEFEKFIMDEFGIAPETEEVVDD